jgi:hypothetical protein
MSRDRETKYFPGVCLHQAGNVAKIIAELDRGLWAIGCGHMDGRWEVNDMLSKARKLVRELELMRSTIEHAPMVREEK